MTEILPWVKWRFDRWRNDEGLRMCGLAARGLWADLLAIMHGGKPYGHLSVNGRAPSTKQIASMVGMTTEKEVATLMSELESNGVFSRSDDGLIFCRRMVRDNAARVKGRVNGLQGGNPVLMADRDEEDNRNDDRGLTPEDKTTLYDREREREREEREKNRSLRSLSAREDFDRFWEAYPNPIDPDAAWTAWRRAVKTADPAEIIAGIARYPFKPDRQFQPKAAKWLANGGWKTPAGASPQSTPDPKAAAKRAATLRGWHDRLTEHHNGGMDGVSVEDIDRASMSREVTGEFMRWLNGIDSGDPWVLEKIAAVRVGQAA